MTHMENDIAFNGQHANPPTIKRGFGAFFILLLGQVIGGFLLGVIYAAFILGEKDSSEVQIAADAIVWGAYGSAIAVSWWLWHERKQSGAGRLRGIGWRSVEDIGKALILVLVALVFVRLAMWGYSFLMASISQASQATPLQPSVAALQASTGVTRAATLLYLLLVAPVVEEIVFRGYLQTALAQKLPAWTAITIAAAIFATYHFNVVYWPALFALGLGLGIAFHRTRALWPAMLLHGLSNLLSAGVILWQAQA